MHSFLPKGCVKEADTATILNKIPGLELNTAHIHTILSQPTIQADLPRICLEKDYVHLPKDMWLTADVFIKRKMLLFWEETDVKKAFQGTSNQQAFKTTP